MATSMETKKGNMRRENDKVCASGRLANPSATKQDQIVKCDLMIGYAANIKENLHESRTSRDMGDPIRVEATSKATWTTFVTKS